MLSIPYIRQTASGKYTFVSIRFRCIVDHDHKGHGKYMTLPGDRPRMFNTSALLGAESEVGISEGELDAITASLCGIPTVGIPGATSWQPHFVQPFEGYETVFIFADGDEPGMKFATTVAKTLPNSKIIPCPDGMDVNSLVLRDGKRALTDRIK